MQKQKQKSLEKQHLRHIITRTLTWPTHTNPESGSRKRLAFEDADYLSSGESDIKNPAISTSEVRVNIKHQSCKPATAADASKQQAAEDSDVPLILGRRRLSNDPDYEDDDSDSTPTRRTSRKRRVSGRNALAPRSSSGTMAKRRGLKKLSAETGIAGERSAFQRSSRVPLPPCQPDLARPDAEDDLIILDHSPFHHQTPTSNRLNLPANVINSTQLIVQASTQTHMAPAIVCLSACRNVHDLFAKLTSKCSIRADLAEKISTISATYTWSGKQQRLCKGDDDDFEMFCRILGKAWEKDPARFKDECEISILLHVDE